FATLAMRRAPVWQWAALWVVLALLNLVILEPFALVVADPFRWLLILPGLLLALFALAPFRKAVLTGPAYAMVKRILPRVSRTEQEALDAGTVGWDAEL